MQIGSSARRYARALFELGLETGGDPQLDTWLEQLQDYRQFLRDRQVYPILENPAIAFDEKRKLLDAALADADPKIRNFILLVVSRNRINLIDEIIAAFRNRVYEHRGIAVAEVRTAVQLTDEQRQRLTTRLGQYLNKKIVVHEQLDPSIVGGAVILVGDKLIDASILGRLESLHDQLVRPGY